MADQPTPSLPDTLQQQLDLEFTGKDRDHVVTFESNPELMKTMMQRVLRDFEDNNQNM